MKGGSVTKGGNPAESGIAAVTTRNIHYLKRFTANLSSRGYEWINKVITALPKGYIPKKITRAPKTIKLWWSIYIPHLLAFSSIQSFICASLLFAISCEDTYSAKQNIIRGIDKGWFCREEQCSNSMHHHSTDPVIIIFTKHVLTLALNLPQSLFS